MYKIGGKSDRRLEKWKIAAPLSHILGYGRYTVPVNLGKWMNCTKIVNGSLKKMRK